MNLMLRRKVSSSVTQYKKSCIGRAKMWTYRIQRILLTLIFCYTLLYLLLWNEIYITFQNHTHKMSINIRFRQVRERLRDKNDETRKQMEHPVEESKTSIEQLQVPDPTQETAEQVYIVDDGNEYLSYQDNERYEQQSDAHYDVEELEQPFGEQTGQSEKYLLEKKNKQPFYYDHPVLRRIEDKNVFYISAIADKHSFRSLLATFQDGGINDSIYYQNNESTGDDQNNSFDDPHKTVAVKVDTINWIKSRAFLQPLTLYSNLSRYGTITLNGWEGYKFAKMRYFCCYRYDDGIDNGTENTEVSNNKQNNIRKNKKRRKKENKMKQKYENNVNNTVSQSSLMMWKNIWNEHNLKIIKAAQFVCPLIPQVGGSNRLPTKVALSDKENCNTKKILKYINIEDRLPGNSDSIAICAKLVYGNYSAERLIEWFEFNKLMGVEKVMLFTHDVVQDVEIVLNHYADEGLLIIKLFDFPAKSTFRRKPGGKNTMAFEDEQVTVFDCTERFNNFKFVAVLDLDEFLVPAEAANHSGTWRTMLSQLQRSHPNASGFVFKTQIFTLDWGISNPTGNLFITKYIQRTTTMWDRRKNIIIPERTQRGMVWTHSYTGAVGYTRVTVSPDIAKVFHYRKCRPDWIVHHTCMSGRAKHADKTMLYVMSRIERNISEKKNKLLRK